MLFSSCPWWGKLSILTKCFWREKKNAVAFYAPVPIDHADNLGREGCHTPAPCEHQPPYSYGAGSFSALSGCIPGAHPGCEAEKGGKESLKNE